MIYRKIKDDEIKDFANLGATVFFCSAEDAYKEIEEGKFLKETIRVLMDDEGKMIAGLRLYDLEMFLDTGYVRTGGIGDVSSYPESRRQGNISKLYEHTLREMYEEGYVLSYLYPFSHPFYRKYGYELCRQKDTVTLQTKSIALTQDNGCVKQHIFGTEMDLSEDIKTIYNEYADGMNMMLNRKGWFWDRILEANPFTGKSRLYVFYLEDGTPTAYFQYDYEKVDFSSFNIKIFDMAYISRKAFNMMINFVYKLYPSVVKVSFRRPPVLDCYSIIDEPWNVEMKSEGGGMLRIINAAKALNAMKAPMINTKLKIKVNDMNIKENNNIYCVDINMGELAAKEVSVTETYDME